MTFADEQVNDLLTRVGNALTQAREDYDSGDYSTLLSSTERLARLASRLRSYTAELYNEWEDSQDGE
jgi:hypothetical protein